MLNAAQIVMVDHSATPGAVGHPEAAWRLCGICLKQRPESRFSAGERLAGEHIPAIDWQARVRREAERLARADRRAALVGRLRLAGNTFREIALIVGLSLAGTHKAYSRFRRTMRLAGLLDEEDLEGVQQQALVPAETPEGGEVGQ